MRAFIGEVPTNKECLLGYCDILRLCRLAWLFYGQTQCTYTYLLYPHARINILSNHVADEKLYKQDTATHPAVATASRLVEVSLESVN